MGLLRRRRPTRRATTSGSSADPPSATRLTASVNTRRSPTFSLRKITNSLRTVGDQVECVTILEKLGQHQHPHTRFGRADLKRRAEPVIGVIRRHLDVSNHHVRAVGARLPDQFARVGGRPDHLEPAALEDAHDTLAHDGLVLADEYPDPGGLSHATKATRLPRLSQ